MESLPSELKLDVLMYCNYDTLKATMRASPSYYVVYCSYRSEILLSAILIHIAQNPHLNFAPPLHWRSTVHGPHGNHIFCVVRLCAFNPKVSAESYKSTLETYYAAIEDEREVILSLEQCKALVAIQDIMGYKRGCEGPVLRSDLKERPEEDHFQMSDWAYNADKSFECPKHMEHRHHDLWLVPMMWGGVGGIW